MANYPRNLHDCRSSPVFRVPEHASLPHAVLCRHENASGRPGHVCTYDIEGETTRNAGEEVEEEVEVVVVPPQSDVESGRVSRERNPSINSIN